MSLIAGGTGDLRVNVAAIKQPAKKCYFLRLILISRFYRGQRESSTRNPCVNSPVETSTPPYLLFAERFLQAPVNLPRRFFFCDRIPFVEKFLAARYAKLCFHPAACKIQLGRNERQAFLLDISQ